MSAIRPLLGPLTGTAVAGVILYSMTGTLSTRTHQLSESLHMSSRILRRLAQVDDTEDLLSKAHVAPDTATLASNYENFKESGKDQLRAAYTQPSRPSLREEIKARWNVSATPLRRGTLKSLFPSLLKKLPTHAGSSNLCHAILIRD